MSSTGKHQGVIAYAAAYQYAEIEDMFALAKEKGEPPFLFLLDGIEAVSYTHLDVYKRQALTRSVKKLSLGKTAGRKSCPFGQIV